VPARADDGHPVPQAIRLSNQATLEFLTQLTTRSGPVGVEARKLQPIYSAHMAKENEFVLPPLTLLPALARGQATPDMAWAIAMSDRLKAEQVEIYRTHAALAAQFAALDLAAQTERDNAVREWVRAAVVDDLNDLETIEPTTILIGDILRARLNHR
jgi:hypothetical protein